MKNLKLIKSLTTEEVFKQWRKIEANLPHWKSFYKAKGYKSWDEWRKTTHATVLKTNLNWRLYEIKNPLEIIPDWYGGMFHGWDKWFYGVFKEVPPKLKDLLTHPGVHNHWYIRSIAKKFPRETVLTAVRSKNKIYVTEGMHRACALAMMAHEKKILKSKVFVMLADWPGNKPPKLGHWSK